MARVPPGHLCGTSYLSCSPVPVWLLLRPAPLLPPWTSHASPVHLIPTTPAPPPAFTPALPSALSAEAHHSPSSFSPLPKCHLLRKPSDNLTETHNLCPVLLKPAPCFIFLQSTCFLLCYVLLICLLSVSTQKAGSFFHLGHC